MRLPLRLTFRHMDHSAALEARIRRRVEELDQVFRHIISCRVIVECRHHHHRQGRLFGIHIDLNVPGREIAVGRDDGDHAHENAYVAVRDAFDAARRRLEEHAREGRGMVKLHAVADRA